LLEILQENLRQPAGTGVVLDHVLPIFHDCAAGYALRYKLLPHGFGFFLWGIGGLELLRRYEIFLGCQILIQSSLQAALAKS